MGTDTDTGFSQWCILELMGHRRLAGLVTEATLAGGSFLRIDIYGEEPDDGGMVAGGIAQPADPDEPIVTQFYSPSSVYAITPTTETICRRMGMKFRPQPVSEWDLLPSPERATATAHSGAFDPDDDEDPY